MCWPFLGRTKTCLKLAKLWTESPKIFVGQALLCGVGESNI